MIWYRPHARRSSEPRETYRQIQDWEQEIGEEHDQHTQDIGPEATVN